MHKFEIGDTVQIHFTSGDMNSGIEDRDKPHYYRYFSWSYLQHLHGQLCVIKKLEEDSLTHKPTYIAVAKDIYSVSKDFLFAECDLRDYFDKDFNYIFDFY